MSRAATVLIGSPRGPGSTSNALGTYLLERLREKAVNTNIVYIQQSLNSDEGVDTLLQAVYEADLVILVAPLYADSHHSGVVKAMELIHENLRDRPRTKRQAMVAISNSGFPESSHNELSLAISRRFALECGFEWAGGLALGGGEAIAGRPLREAGGLARNVRKSLDIAATALATGGGLPDEAVKLMARPLISRWLYLAIGNIGWIRKARAHKCAGPLDYRPYGE